jgi:hypothetical protein
VLPRFAADLEWLKSQSISVERYNLSQQPAAFASNPIVRDALARHGTQCLPLIVVDEQIVSCGSYPSRDVLASWTGVAAQEPEFVSEGASCCGGSRCC